MKSQSQQEVTDAQRDLLYSQIAARVETLEKELKFRELIREKWNNVPVVTDSMTKYLFVVFMGQDIGDLHHVEEKTVSANRFTPNEVFESNCTTAYPKEIPIPIAKGFVSASISRRRKFIEREMMIFDFIIDGWKGVNLQSDLMFQQISAVFQIEKLEAVQEFEMARFMERKFVFSKDLRFFKEEKAVLPDGSQFCGLYKKINSNKRLPLCSINFEFVYMKPFINFNEYALAHHYGRKSSIHQLPNMPAFLKSDSNEKLVLESLTRYWNAPTSIYRRVFSELPKSSESVAMDIVSGKAARSKSNIIPSNISFLDAAVSARKQQLIVDMVPADILEDWDELHGVDVKSPETAPSDKEQFQNAVSASIPMENVTDDGGLTVKEFEARFSNFCEGLHWKTFERRSWVDVVRTLLQNCVEIVFDLHEYTLASRIFPMLHREMTRMEIALFLFVDEIKHVNGSLVYLISQLLAKK